MKVFDRDIFYISRLLIFKALNYRIEATVKFLIIVQSSVAVYINRQHRKSIDRFPGLLVIDEHQRQVGYSVRITQQGLYQVFICSCNRCSFDIFLLEVKKLCEHKWYPGFL